MSEEMATQMPDSPTGASDNNGAGSAILDMVRENVEPTSYAQDVNTQGVQESYDVYDLLGVEQPTSEPQVQDDLNPVPYDRFKEVNDKARNANERLSKWGDVIQEFERQGFNSADDLRQTIIKQQQQAQEQQIVDRYRELEAQELVDPTTGNLQMQAELERFRYQQAMSQVSQFMIDQQKTTAINQYPLAKQNPEAVDSLIANGLQPDVAARVIHEQIEKLSKALVPQLLSKLQAGRTAPTPTNNSQTARPAVSNGGQQQSQGGRQSLAQLMGISRGRQNI
jgi:hypothetical protein